MEENAALVKQCEEMEAAKAKELDQMKQRVEETQQELLLTRNKVCVTSVT